MMKSLRGNTVPYTGKRAFHADQDHDRGHALSHPEKAPRPVHRGLAQEPPHGDPQGGRGARADGARPAHRRLHGPRRRLADALPGRAGARDRRRRREHYPSPFLGRAALHRRGLGLERNRRRALPLEALGRDPHPRLELAPARQRRREERALHELLLRADALDARHVAHRRPRARALFPPLPPARGGATGGRRDNATTPTPPPPRPAFTEGPQGNDPYARRLRRLANEARKRRSGRIHTPYDEQDLLATPRGTRTKFLVDRAIGSEASGITQVMIQFAPGKTQSLHRHPGEAWLYVVEGHGHSFMGTAPDKGEHHRWKKGDLIIVDHYLWHQHFNDDPKNQARLVRVHMFDSILETMRALTDPLVLFEEAEDTLLSVQEVSQIEWPDDWRPES